MIGGALSRPAERFPNVFGNSKFLKEYPYFLPCAVPATFTVVAWLLAFFFLKEVCGFIVSHSTALMMERSGRLTPHRSQFGSSFVERKSELDLRKTLFSPPTPRLGTNSRNLCRCVTSSREM